MVCADDAQVAELERLVELFKSAYAAEELAEAEALAKTVVEHSVALRGRNSKLVANSLTNLAIVQQRQRQFVPAMQNYVAAIETIEYVEGPLSPDLIEPLKGLGETQLAMEEVALARLSFERGVHISHVNHGPRNTDQVILLDAIAETQILTGNMGDALQMQKNIFALQAQGIDPESEDMLPALQHHADWMRRLGLPNREKNTYWKILEIQERHNGKHELALLPTLIALGGSVRPGGHSVTERPRALESLSELDDRYVDRHVSPDYYMRRALSIATEHPESDWKLATTSALVIGDFYSRARRLVRAKLAYVDAWERLSDSPERLAVRREELESPMPLTRPRLPRYYENQRPVYGDVDKETFQRGTMTAVYDVSKLGKTVNIKVIEKSPGNLRKIEERFVDRLGDVVHRPRMQDGTMVDTYQLDFVYEFFYRIEDSD